MRPIARGFSGLYLGHTGLFDRELRVDGAVRREQREIYIP